MSGLNLACPRKQPPLVGRRPKLQHKQGRPGQRAGMLEKEAIGSPPPARPHAPADFPAASFSPPPVPLSRRRLLPPPRFCARRFFRYRPTPPPPSPVPTSPAPDFAAPTFCATQTLAPPSFRWFCGPRLSPDLTLLPAPPSCCDAPVDVRRYEVPGGPVISLIWRILEMFVPRCDLFKRVSEISRGAAAR